MKSIQKSKKSFRNALNMQVKPEKINSTGTAPELLQITKLSGNKSIPEFEAGKLVRISGKRMAFNEEDTETGVFLRAGGREAIRVDEYANIGNINILLRLPDNLEPESYTVEVRSRKRSGKIDRGILPWSIIVAA